MIGVNAILLVGDSEVQKYSHLKSDGIFVSGYAPHSALFPRACAVVHHGGIGTIAQAMRAGVPQLTSPRYGDQFDNAYRLRAKGLGQTISVKDYRADIVAQRLTAILSNQDYADVARSVSNAMAGEDGAVVVADFIRQAMKGGES